MKYYAKKVLVQSVGLAFILLGLVGLVLPILQGILFLIVGLLLLSIHSHSVRSFVHTFAGKHPKAAYYVNKVERFLNKIFGPANPT